MMLKLTSSADALAKLSLFHSSGTKDARAQHKAMQKYYWLRRAQVIKWQISDLLWTSTFTIEMM